MIIELFIGIIMITGAAVLLSTFIDWAEQIVIGIAGAILGVLYATRRAAGAFLEVFTQTRDGRWLTTTREVSESELPAELQNISRNDRTRVAEYNPN
jgi:hypothetical protein